MAEGWLEFACEIVDHSQHISGTYFVTLQQIHHGQAVVRSSPSVGLIWE
jgi:hypothetical protein